MRQENDKQGPDKPPSRKRIENEKLSILWHFEGMDHVHRAMQGTTNLEQIMRDVLDTLLSVFECDRAWLVYPCDPDHPTWQVPMERARPEYPEVLPIGVEFPLDPIRAEVYRILRNTDGPVKFGPGEKYAVPAEMAAFQVKSFIAMAFYPKIGKPWSLGVHQCSYARVWTPEEERLFQEIGRRLSDSLTSLLAYRNLQESEEQIKHLIDASPVAMVVSSGDNQRVEWVNAKFVELFGYTVEDMPDVEHWWPLAYPDEGYRAEIRAKWAANAEQAIREKGQIRPMEATVRCKDGSQRYIEFRLSSIGEKHLVTFVDLTQRKQAEDALSASEAELRSLINTMTDIVFVGNSEGRFLKIVDTSPSLLYKPSRELLGRTLHEVFPKEQADFFLKHLRQALNTRKSVNFEYSLPIGGQELWFYATVSPMTDDKTLMVARDITDLKKAQSQLLANEQLFRALVENSPDFVARYDREFRRIYVNPAIQKLFGVAAENVLGKTPSEQSPVYAPEVYIDYLRHVIETSTEAATEMPYRTANGEVHWGHMRFVPEFGPDGQVASVLAIGRDIHEIKENERRFRMLAENFPDLVMRFDHDGRHIYVNPAFEQTFGMPAEAVIGKTLQELPWLSKNEENSGTLAQIQRAFDEGTANEAEVGWDTKIGERIFETRYVPEKDAAGTVVTVLCIARDVTERKQAEAELRQNREVTLQFSKQLAALQDVTIELSKVGSVDELCLQAVQLGRSRLEFDRVSVWFIEEHLGIMRGSFGTDEHGQLRDERNAQVEFRHEGLAWQLFSNKDPLALVEPRPLYDHLGQQVGLGENAMAALWDGGKVIGVISVDNLSTGQHIRDHQLEVLRLYATTLGHLITRKLAENALRESEEKYRLLHENAGVGIGYYKPNGEIISYNQLAASYMKGKPEDFEGKSIYEVFPSDEADVYMERIRESLESQSTLEYEDHLVLAPGQKWFLSIFTKIRDTQQNVIGVQIISQDITEQKQTAEALRASENRFRVLSENAFVGIYIIQDGRLSYVNSTLAKIFGYTAHELIGAEPALVIHPDDQAMVSENIRRRIVGEVETVHYEFRGRCKDGRTKNIEVLGGRIDFGGKTAVIGNLMDITDRKLAEDEIARSLAAEKKARKVAEILREANESLSRKLHLDDVLQNLLLYLRHLVPYDSANVMLLEGDLQLRVAALRGYEHWTDPDAAGKLVFDIRAIPSLNEVITTQKSIMIANTYEYPGWVRVAGTEHIVSWLGIPIITGGQVIGLYSVDKVEPAFFTDEHRLLAEGLAAQAAVAIQNTRLHDQITRANVELERRVSERTAQLEGVNQELEAFAYSISHDLRAPLRHVDGFIELLQKRVKSGLDEKSQHYMEMIADSAKQMGQLIDDLLSFSRMGRSEMITAHVDLGKLLDEVLLQLAAEPEFGRVAFYIAPLPSVRGDRSMLKIVFTNLISNGLKFTRSREHPQIEIGFFQDLDEVVIFVRDNGVGFDMKYADKLFGVFQRLHRQEEFEGTGIGLANVRRIINRHGGRTWAEGKVDHGATFYFSLPISK